MSQWLRTQTAMGRFALVDASGVAIVTAYGTDYLVVQAGGDRTTSDAAIVVTEGGVVEVVGIATPVTLPPDAAALATFRENPRAVVLAPPPGGPLLVLVRA